MCDGCTTWGALHHGRKGSKPLRQNSIVDKVYLLGVSSKEGLWEQLVGVVTHDLYFLTIIRGQPGPHPGCSRSLYLLLSTSGCVQVGNDASGIDYRRQLEAEGVDTSQLRTSQTAATGMAFISVDDNGGNQIIISAGANSDIAPEEVQGSFSSVTYVVV